MEARDLGFVAREHLRHFPRGFFARLGPWFLEEYYRTFLTGPEGHTVIAEESGQPVGYLVGVSAPVGHRDHVVRRHGRALVLRAAGRLLVRPDLCLLFLRTRAVRYLTKLLARRRRGQGGTPSSSPAVLTHVAVTPTHHGWGIGSRLVGWFEDEVAACGCERIVLVTASGREGAGEFYERRSWHRTGEHSTPDGQRLSTYERQLRPAAQGRGVVVGA
jgi:GNAT superfamily N-acetyltransferase